MHFYYCGTAFVTWVLGKGSLKDYLNDPDTWRKGLMAACGLARSSSRRRGWDGWRVHVVVHRGHQWPCPMQIQKMHILCSRAWKGQWNHVHFPHERPRPFSAIWDAAMENRGKKSLSKWTITNNLLLFCEEDADKHYCWIGWAVKLLTWNSSS